MTHVDRNNMQSIAAASIEGLAPDQLAAVTHRGSPLRIVAGAGTGKTATLTSRFIHLVTEDKVDPGAILALTFTRKAAGEMRGRITRQLAGSYSQLWIDTFHSFCLRVLRKEHARRRLLTPTVIDGGVRWQVMHAALDGVEFPSYRAQTDQLIREALLFADRARDELVSPTQALTVSSARNDQRFIDLANAFALYVAMLRQKGIFDFNQLQTQVLEAFADPATLSRWQSTFHSYLVDEYQDVNTAQARIVKLLAREGETLAVVGDIDQAIYAFRGASHRFLESFTIDYPGAKEVILANSYRSHAAILDVANTAIAENLNTSRAVLHPIDGRTGALPQIVEAVNEEDEAREVARRIAQLTHGQGVSPGDIAILLRSIDVAGAPFERALHRVGVPVVVTGASGLEIEAVADVLAVLRLIDTSRKDDLFRVLTRRDADPVDILIARGADDERSLSTSGTVIDALLEKIRALADRSLPEQVYDAAELCGHLPLPDVVTRVHRASVRALRDMLVRAEALDAAGGDRHALILELQAALEPPETENSDHPDAVQIMTVHAAKGIEFEHVFVAGLARARFPLEPRVSRHNRTFNISDSSFWQSMHSTPDAQHDVAREFLEEERRLFYVAMTRARNGLTLSYPLMLRGAVESPSQFVLHLREAATAKIEESPSEPDGTWTLNDLARAQRELILRAIDTVDLTPRLFSEALLAQWTLSNLHNSAPWRPLRPPVAYANAEPLRLSHSSIDTYRTCQRQYFYRHVLRVDAEARSPYLSRGNALHAAIQWMNEQRMHGIIPPFDDVRDALQLKWSSRGFECTAQENQVRQRAVSSLRRFYDWEIQQGREILEVERRFELPIGDHTLVGRIDCVARRPDGTIEILDYKSGNRRSTTKIEATKQLALYHLAWTHERMDSDPTTTLLFLGHDKDRSQSLVAAYEPARQTWSMTHTPESVTNSREMILGVADNILNNRFATTTDPRACRRCEFRHCCEGASRDA